MFFRALKTLLLVSVFSSHGLEIGAGSGITYIREETTWATSFHLHLTKEVFRGETFTGLSFESVADEHGHSIVSLMIGKKFGDVSMSYMPGIYVSGGSGIAHHFEVSYSVELGSVHLGPFLSASFGEDTHYTVGLHVGIHL